MSKKKPDIDDDDEKPPISKKEIARLLAAHEKMKALREQSAKEEGVEESDLREWMGDENFEIYKKRRDAYEEGERRRHGIKSPPPQKKSDAESLADIPAPKFASPTTDFPEIMTIEQVAEYLQLHPQVVYRNIRAGTIPVSRVGRTIRVKKSVLDEFLETGAWNSIGDFLRFLKEHGRYPPEKPKPDEPPPKRNRFSVDVD